MLHAPTQEARDEKARAETSSDAARVAELSPLTGGRTERRAFDRSEQSAHVNSSSASPVDASSATSRQTLAGLQSTHGNQAVLRLLRRASRDGAGPVAGGLLQRKCACGGHCSECGRNREIVQAKLRVSSPEDQFEREADQTAESVLRSPMRDGARDAESVAASSESILRSIRPTGSATAHGVPTNENAQARITDVIGGVGHPLPAPVRAFMEPRFGQDFGGVRVHTDARAAESARAVNAHAYTVGDNVVFAHAQYAPETTAGRRLLAHELTHVLQQRAGLSSPAVVQRDDANEESETGFVPATGDEAKDCLARVDKSIEAIKKRVDCAKGPEAEDLRDALKTLSDMRSKNKVVCGTRNIAGKVYASFDNKTHEIHIYTNKGAVQDSPSNLIHEAIHAVHAERFPKVSEKYSTGKAQGDDVTLLLKWKAWTEYWAYRRAAEYDNLDPNRTKENKLDPDKEARSNKDVHKSIAAVFDATSEAFNPETWTPPEKYRAKKPDQSTASGQKQSAADAPAPTTDAPDERAAKLDLLMNGESCQAGNEEETVST
ncbi:MAG: hypothetical protein QOE33_3460 [Acidobacteriota bacterium]|nr:hypothetical protein [Acidobacteriota bacterium]